MCVPSWAALPDKDIIILYTNDVHCGVDENLGYAGFAYCRDEARKNTPYVTLVDAGDWAQGGTIGAISHGRYLLEIMNEVGYDIAIPGNHEFDYGWSQFENFAKNLKCGFISCNIRDLRTGRLIFKPYKILEYGDVKVAFVGVTTPESIIKSAPSNFQNDKGEFIYGFDGEDAGKKLIASIQKAVDDARAEGADYVIVVGHLGEYEDIVVQEWATPYIAPRTSGIDVFIDGHSHEVTPCLVFKNADGKDVIITQTGTKLTHVGKLTINTKGEVKTELLSGFDGRDEKTAKFVAEIKAKYEDTLKTHLTYTSFDLVAMDASKDWLVRTRETNLSDLVTDAFLASARDTKTKTADIALVNGGGMRNNIAAGEITIKNALDVLPFGNTVCICEIPGQSIIDELELGVRLMPDRSGGFIHVSGLTYTVDTRIPSPVILDENQMLKEISGDRRVSDVKVNGEPIDPDKKYKVVSISFLLYMKGDGHVFKGVKVVEPDYITADSALSRYLRNFDFLPEKYREPQGRITIIK